MHTHILTRNSIALPFFSPPWNVWLRRMRTRAALRELDCRRLADIGHSVAEQQSECAKWFWQT